MTARPDFQGCRHCHQPATEDCVHLVFNFAGIGIGVGVMGRREESVKNRFWESEQNMFAAMRTGQALSSFDVDEGSHVWEGSLLHWPSGVEHRCDLPTAFIQPMQPAAKLPENRLRAPDSAAWPGQGCVTCIQ